MKALERLNEEEKKIAIACKCNNEVKSLNAEVSENDKIEPIQYIDKSSLTSEELKQLGKARELIIILNKMNYIVVETESKEYFGKYNIEIYELYSEMKLDLTKMLGIEDIWEEM